MKLSVEMTPANTPTQRDATGWTNIPHAALIITPPANVALQISAIENFYLINALVIKVAKQLPDIDKTVFIMMMPL